MDVPTSEDDLDAASLIALSDYDVGDTIWVPVSLIRGNKFRAYKITIESRVSTNGFEEHNALEEWDDDGDTTIIGPADDHKDAEGYE